jgi:hypothetical protein
MVSRQAVLRIARPTDNIRPIAQMYQQGLGFELLGQFEDHQGFDGVIIGHPTHHYHLEFTHHRGTRVGRAPTEDNLLVFYIPNAEEWQWQCGQMEQAGFVKVASYNPYWDQTGSTFEDADGYRVVLAKRDWTA